VWGVNNLVLGGGLPSLLMGALEGQLSGLAIRHRAVSRKIRKFSRSGPRFTTQVGYAPRRIRLGNLFRLIRLLSISGVIPLGGVRARFGVSAPLSLWALCGIQKVRDTHNLQLRAYAQRRPAPG